MAKTTPTSAKHLFLSLIMHHFTGKSLPHSDQANSFVSQCSCLEIAHIHALSMEHAYVFVIIMSNHIACEMCTIRERKDKHKKHLNNNNNKKNITSMALKSSGGPSSEEQQNKIINQIQEPGSSSV